MKRIVLYSLVILTSYCFGQRKSSNIILASSEVQNIYFYKYDPPFKVKAEIYNKDEVVNRYPEQLLQSVLSANTQEWVNENVLGGEKEAGKKSESHFERIREMDRDKNYMELVHKITFKIDERPTAIMKFYLHQEDTTTISGAMVVQKIGERWYKTSNINLSMLAIIVMRLKSEVLSGIVLGNSKDLNIKAVVEKVTIDGKLDLSALEKEFYTWYEEGNNAKKEFIDPIAW